MEALLVPVGAAWHAIALTTVLEVVRAPTMSPVPRAPIWLLGLANRRGEIVPVLDSAAALGEEPLTEPTHLVVVETVRGRAAVAASAAPNTIELGEPSGASERHGACGQFTLGDKVASLLDVEALVASQ